MLLKRSVSSFLLIAFTLVSVPKELIHELHQHEDTLHLSCSINGTNVSEEHKHCEYLNLQVQPFSFSYCFILNNSYFFYSVFKINETYSLPFPHREVISLRGPPFIA